MPYHVYILYSVELDRYYVGHRGDFSDRLRRHLNWGSPSTKGARGWELKWEEVYATRSEAVVREPHIKSRKSRKYIEELIGGGG
jgi:putative endonuclease